MDAKKTPYGVAPNIRTDSVLSDKTEKPQFAPTKNNSLAITALVLGILSFVLNIIAAIPGVIFGHMALSKVRRLPDEYEGRGMAITGLVFSYFILIVSLIFIGVFIYIYLTLPGFKEEFLRGFNSGLN